MNLKRRINRMVDLRVHQHQASEKGAQASRLLAQTSSDPSVTSASVDFRGFSTTGRAAEPSHV